MWVNPSPSGEWIEGKEKYCVAVLQWLTGKRSYLILLIAFFMLRPNLDQNWFFGIPCVFWILFYWIYENIKN